MSAQRFQYPATVLAALVIPGVFAAGRTYDQPASPTDAPVPTISAVTVPATDVVFVEHVGPYWTIGRKASETRAYMETHGITGPVFVRYPQPPRRRTARDTRCEIGFVSETAHAPDPPFRLAHRPEELVASLTVVGRLPDPKHDYENLNRWIVDQGYVAAGPITEVYYPVQPFRDAASARAEMRFTLKRDASAENEESVAVVIPEVTEDENAVETESATADAPCLVPMVVPPEPTSPLTNPVQPAPYAASVGTTEPDRTTVAHAPTEIPTPSASPRDSEAPAPAADRVAPTPDAAESQSVEELLASEQFARAAEVILPSEVPTSSSDRVWLGQVVLRIEAAATGLARLEGADARMMASFGALSEAIEARYALLSNPSVTGWPGVSGSSTDAHSDPMVRPKREVIDGLDMLLGRISVRSILAPEARDQLYRILVRLKELRPIIESPHRTGPGR